MAEMLAYHFGYAPFGPARRGKRLRPTIVMRAALANGAALEDALDAAAAIELLHNYSLVHDDIEDRDEMRHGKPTLWTKYGVAQAVNAGDAMCALSFLTLASAQSRLPAARVLAMVEMLHDAHLRMCRGQAMDLQFERETHVDLPSYTAMIAGKTAALFGAACALGAQCAQTPAATLDALQNAGVAYGLAFQIHDDVLGIWADSDATGKVTGVDILRRKWTFPVVWALEQPRCAARDTVVRAYEGGESIGAVEAATVVAALDDIGAREAARRAVAEHLSVVERLPRGGVREFLLETLQPALV